MNNDAAISLITAYMGERRPYFMAIDGGCAAGKTTLAAQLAARLGGNVIHIDDFYLPADCRTDAPGGNIDIERLKTELLTPLAHGKSGLYRPYCCSAGRFEPGEPMQPTEITILEGGYSCHPELWDMFDLHIFMSISPELQLQRLREREPQQLEAFKSKWIPRERFYHSICRPRERCEIVLS